MPNPFQNCKLCPRDCGANRLADQLGFCGANADLRVARAGLHHWEEPCLSGKFGSGAVFFTGCNLRCVFCQNCKISQGGVGEAISVERLVEIFFELQNQKAHNLNLVTPTHYLPHLISAITEARKQGLRIPFVYNSNAYEKPENLRQLNGLIEIYLPDLKYFSPEISARYSAAPDYFRFASESLREMFYQVGEPKFDADGIMQKGLIVRHLVLPNQVRDSLRVLDFLAEEFGDSIFVSLMSQYLPFHQAKNYPEINRKITAEEYKQVTEYAQKRGLKNLFLQDFASASAEFIPSFDLTGI